MGEELSDARALELARSLTSIGLPFIAVAGTAEDLQIWCRGTKVDGIYWNPDKQATWLVRQARETWFEGWPQKAGTAKLRGLFRDLYEKYEAPQAPAPLSYEETVAKGLIRPPCPSCDDSGYTGKRPDIVFCACVHGRHQQQWDVDGGALQRANAEPIVRKSRGALKPFTPITEEQMKQALEDEQRRRTAQLKQLRLD